MGLVDLFIVAMMPVIKTLLITAVGLYLALDRVDILAEAARHHLNKIVFFVFMPALLASSLADSVTESSVVSLWFMPVNILLTFIIGSALGWILAKITKTPTHLHGLVISFCAAGSLGMFPLIIIPAVCQEKNSPFGDSSTCNTKGEAYVSLSLTIGAIYVWTYVYWIIQAYGNGSNNTNQDSSTLNIDYVNVRSSEASTDSCTDEALLSKSRSEISYLHEDKVPILKKIGIHVKRLSTNLNLKSLINQITIATIVGLLIGVISPIRKLMIGDSAPLRVINSSVSMLGEAAVPSVTLIMGANLLKGLRSSRVGFWLIFGIVVVRYIALPLFGILVVKAASHFGLIGPDSLYQYVLMLQYVLPPTSAIGTTTQLFRVNESECSVIMLWTYAVASLFLTFWSTFYLWLVS